MLLRETVSFPDTAETCGSADEAIEIMRRIARKAVFLHRVPMFYPLSRLFLNPSIRII
jgi:hypothetical protein